MLNTFREVRNSLHYVNRSISLIQGQPRTLEELATHLEELIRESHDIVLDNGKKNLSILSLLFMTFRHRLPEGPEG